MNICSWSKILLPDFSRPLEVIEDAFFADTISSVRRIPIENSEFIVPDPKAVRSMSRASLMLSSMAAEMAPVLKPYLEKSPFSVGIYCAVENGPIDGPSTAGIVSRTSEKYDASFVEGYRKLRNPKMYLKQLPNLVPAQLGISLGIQGPMNVYTHSIFAAQQALEQGSQDLDSHLVDCALIVSAHAFDDYMVVKRTRMQNLESEICEGAAAIILTRAQLPETENEFLPGSIVEQKISFGISDYLIRVIQQITNLNQGEKHGTI